MQIKEGRYISHVWFINSAERDKDWMCWVWRDPGEPWQVEYRFRYYKDDKPHDSADEKSAFGLQVPSETSEALVIKNMDAIATMVKRQFNGQLWKVPIESDQPMVAFALLKKQPWFFMKLEAAPS